MKRRYRTRPSGILHIDKPVGISSAQAVSRIKSRFLLAKVGHTGTLDPEAGGLLTICINQGTKLVPFLMPGAKTYRAKMRLGCVTDTHDIHGEVLETHDPVTDESKIAEAMQSFVGKIDQIPPMFSAKKREGQPLYKMARRGETVDREPVPIEIYSIKLEAMEDTEVTFTIKSGKGCYVRTVCHDVGRKLGCGATMTELTRLENAGFSLANAVPLNVLTKEGKETLFDYFIPLADDSIPLPKWVINEEIEDTLYYGRPVTKEQAIDVATPFPGDCGKTLRLVTQEQKLAAIVEVLYPFEKWEELPDTEPVLKILRGFETEE